MEEQFVSFDNFNQANQSSAWIPRVFSHLRKKSESMPTDIDNSGLHILTSFAPWGASADQRRSSSISRRKSNSADSILIDQLPSTCFSPELRSVAIERSSSKQSMHARSASLPATFGEYLPEYFTNLDAAGDDQRTNERRRPILRLGESHSVIFEGTGLSMYTIYIIEIESISPSQKSKLKIKKRYSEFKELYDNLSKIYGIRLPVFPAKSVMGKLIILILREIFEFNHTK